MPLGKWAGGASYVASTRFSMVRCVVQCVQVNRAGQLGGVVFARPTDTVYYIKGGPQPHFQSVRPGQPELALHFEEAPEHFDWGAGQRWRRHTPCA